MSAQRDRSGVAIRSSATAGKRATYRTACLVCGRELRRYDVPEDAPECQADRGLLSAAVRDLIRRGVLPELGTSARIHARNDPRVVARARELKGQGG